MKIERLDCTAANLVHSIEYVGYTNIISITTNKSSTRAWICTLTNVEYDNKPESFTIMFNDVKGLTSES